MKRRDIAFGASWGFAVAGVATLGWAIYSSVITASPLGFDTQELIVAGLGVVWTLGSFVAIRCGMVVPVWVALVGLLPAAWLSYQGSIPVAGYIKEALIWVGVGLLALSLATFCQVAARTGDDPPEDSQAGSTLRNPALWVAAAASVTATALIAQLLVLHASPLQAQQATELAEAPQLPRDVLGEVTWAISIPGNSLNNAAGVRGPVVAMSDGVVGIDSSDGSVAWQRRRSGSQLCEWTSSPHADVSPSLTDNNYLLVSPNRRFIAYSICVGNDSRYEVLDTMTGALVLEGATRDQPIGQLTNEVFWVGEQGISLADGKVLWEKTATSSMDAISSKFLTIQNCSITGNNTLCTVVTLDQNDPSNHQSFDDVIINNGPETKHSLAQGWVARFVPGTEPPSEKTNVAMQALNLETGETVPLGEFNHMQAVSATQLILERADGTRAAFDPTSRTVTDLDLPAYFELAAEDLPLPEVHGPAWDISKYSRYSRNMRVHIADREVTIPYELPAGVASHAQRPRYSTQAWLAPGCLIVQGLSVTYIAAGKENGNLVHLACLR